MDNQIDCDPQQYKDEWFDIAAIPVGKEFELPNISNTFNQWLVDTSNLAKTPAKKLDINFVCNTRNQLCPLAIAKSTPESAISSGMVNYSGHQKLIRGHMEDIIANSGYGWSSSSNNKWSMSSQAIPLNQLLLVPYKDLSIKPKQEALPDQKIIKTTCIEAEAEADGEGDHKCFVCKVKFASGNALGGHMSAHAKKRKMEVMRSGGLSIFKADHGQLISGLDHEEPQPNQGSEINGSKQPPNESAIIITSAEDSMAGTSIQEKINETSEASKEQDEDGSLLSQTKFARHKEN